MPLWGIVLLGLAAWVLVSVVLGVIIGRAVRVADAHRRDQEFMRQLSRRPERGMRTQQDDAWPRPATSAPAPVPVPPVARTVPPVPGLARR